MGSLSPPSRARPDAVGRGLEAGGGSGEAGRSSEAIVWSTDGGPEGDPSGAPEAAGGVGLDLWLGPLCLLGWKLLGLCALPWLLLHPGARRHILGLLAPEPGWIWLHGASAGEHVAARALARELGPRVWRTSSSWRTPVLGAFPAPLDLPFVVGPWLDRARPSLVVLVEAELWPGWLAACRLRGIPVAVVNARPGRGTDRLRRWGPVWRWLVRGVTFIPQTETGDLKLSTELREATFALGREALVAGSTRPGDEARVLEAWRRLPSTAERPRPLLVLAPRHLDRVPEVWALQQPPERWARRSVGVPADTDVLVLDTMGELAGVYLQARAAFIGGTYDVAIGGHSPAEAIAAGLPVVHGPVITANAAAFRTGVCLQAGEDLLPAFRSALALGPRPRVQHASALRAKELLPPTVDPPPETEARSWLWPVASWVEAATAQRAERGLRARRGLPPFAVPVVSVGSLVAGGAGKTPVVLWLQEQLGQRLGSQAVWVVSRGYGRPARGAGPTEGTGDPRSALRWHQTPGPGLGDELEMLRRRGVPVVSAPDRHQGVAFAIERGARVVLVDDGLQSWTLPRSVDVACIDARWPDGRGPLPVGWRREPWSALDRVDWLWVNHADHAFQIPDELAHKPAVRARHVPVGWTWGVGPGLPAALAEGVVAPLDAVRGPVDVAVGIARPEGFLCTLLALGLELRSVRVVRDHGPLGTLAPGTVVTEKDAARLPEGAPVRVLRMGLQVEGGPGLVEQIVAGATRDRPRPGPVPGAEPSIG